MQQKREMLIPFVLGRAQTVATVATDAAAWAVALLVATVLRHEIELVQTDLSGYVEVAVSAIVLQAVIGLYLGLYRGKWAVASFDETVSLAAVTASVAAIVTFLNAFGFDRAIPMSSAVAGGLLALFLMTAARAAYRRVHESKRRPDGADATRLLVFGAGDAGNQVVGAMMRDPNSRYFPVAILDDSPAKARRILYGVPVVGCRRLLPDAAHAYEADALLIAIPSAGPELIRELSTAAREAGLDVKVLPPVSELFGGAIDASDIRELTEADLLGRREVEIDLDAVAGYLTGKRVLVTGAGGSIGSELCRQIYRFAPSDLLMLDRDESALHAVQLSIQGRALLDDGTLIVADIRDRDRVDEVFAQWKPQVVFHAAALKHLTLLEQHPAEAVKTNVWGTQHLIEAAIANGVEHFVNVSTDKAADPTSVLGYTKRIAERLTAHAANSGGCAFLSVRFGNVLGSRGSVLPTFRAQIEAGGPVTVTDPDVTRYFMTITEAVQLVIQAGAMGSHGDTLVLDMGEPVRIAAVAEQLIAQSGRNIEIAYTGLRPGEKLHEKLLSADEIALDSAHPLIWCTAVPALEPLELHSLSLHDHAGLLEQLQVYATRPDLHSSSVHES